jgi:hypothetical protein
MNYLRGIGTRASNAGKYAARGLERTGARLQRYKGLENKYTSLISNNTARAERLRAKTISKRQNGESLNAFRKRLANARKKGWANWRTGLKESAKAKAKAVRNAIASGLTRAKRFGQNVFAGKLGRSNEERNANWENYYGKRIGKRTESLEWARKADEEAASRQAGIDAVLGCIAAFFIGLPGKLYDLFDGIGKWIAEHAPHIPNWKEISDAFEALGKAIAAAPGEAMKLMNSMYKYLETKGSEGKAALLEALKKILPANAGELIVDGLMFVITLPIKIAGAAAKLVAYIGGKTMSALGAAYTAVAALPAAAQKALCAGPCKGEVIAAEARMRSMSAANAGLRAQTKANQNAAQPAANKLKAWAAGLKPGAAVRRNRRSTRRN